MKLESQIGFQVKVAIAAETQVVHTQRHIQCKLSSEAESRRLIKDVRQQTELRERQTWTYLTF